MDIRFEGTLTKDEYVRLVKLRGRGLVVKGRDTTKTLTAFWPWVVAAGIISAGIGIWLLVAGAEQTAVMGGTLVLMWGLFQCAIGLVTRGSPRKMWEHDEGAQVHREGSISEQSVEERSSLGQSRLMWTNYMGYAEFEDLIVLVTLAGLWEPFPRRFFGSDVDWDALRTLLAERFSGDQQAGSTANPGSWLFRVLIALVVLITLFAVAEHSR